MNKNPTVNRLIKSAVPVAKPRLLIIDTVEGNVDTLPALTKYADIVVNDTGYYNICSQLVLQAKTDVAVDCIQYGICKDDETDFPDNFNSNGSTNVSNDSFVSYNMTTIKYLEKGMTYKAWYNALLFNGSMSYVGDYSNVKIIKL